MFNIGFIKFVRMVDYLDKLSISKIPEKHKFNKSITYARRSKTKIVYYNDNIIEIKISCLLSINIQYIDGMFIYEVL